MYGYSGKREVAGRSCHLTVHYVAAKGAAVSSHVAAHYNVTCCNIVSRLLQPEQAVPSLESRHYAERVKEKRRPTTDVRDPIRNHAPPRALCCRHVASARTERAHTRRTDVSAHTQRRHECTAAHRILYKSP